MKRQLTFNLEAEQYVLKENNQVIFSINAKDLRFVSLEFYNGVYKDKSTLIELTYAIDEDPYKKGRYVFTCLSDIVESIRTEINEPIPEDIGDSLEKNFSKVVVLYELSACAGDGFFMDSESAPDQEIESPYLDADFAVRISGRSMESTINDGDIVFVKRTEELNSGDIGIFMVDQNAMCKRYYKNGEEILLKPDNESGEYESIVITENSSCILQGKVLGR